MEVRCYIAMFLFASLATALSYLIWTRLRTGAGSTTAATPLLPTAAKGP